MMLVTREKSWENVTGNTNGFSLGCPTVFKDCL